MHRTSFIASLIALSPRPPRQHLIPPPPKLNLLAEEILIPPLLTIVAVPIVPVPIKQARSNVATMGRAPTPFRAWPLLMAHAASLSPKHDAVKLPSLQNGQGFLSRLFEPPFQRFRRTKMREFQLCQGLSSRLNGCQGNHGSSTLPFGKSTPQCH